MIDYPNLTDSLPLLITRGLVCIPNNAVNIEISRDKSVAAAREAQTNHNNFVVVVSQMSADVDNPTIDDIYKVGTLCQIISFTYLKNFIRIRVIPKEVVKLTNPSLEGEFYTSNIEILPTIFGDPNEELALFRSITASLERIPEVMNMLPKNVLSSIATGIDADTFSNSLANYLPLSIQQRQELLEARNTNDRLKLILQHIEEEKQIADIDIHLQDELRKSTEKSQKDYFLREKMRIIKEELGDSDDDSSQIEKKLAENPYPEHVKKKVRDELKKLDMMPTGSQEGALIKSYIDVLMGVPWYQKTEDTEDLLEVKKTLDEDHYGMDKPKKRILEYLAVKKLTGSLKAPILCLYGPPGVGKTSLAMSIARALGRKFVKASLGGIYDESEIRGHRRTYVGSMPGRIIKGLIRAGVTNPVFLLDEVDKVGHDSFKGDPSSALLEVMDPEQNSTFSDNYIEEPYDLSNVLFIATANYIENIPAPLLDRLELVEIPSYTELEKIEIAKHYLLPKNLLANGLKSTSVVFEDDAIDYIIMHYTREAGVRELERQINSILRKIAVEVVNSKRTTAKHISIEQVKKYLGVEIFNVSNKEKLPQIGVITGLAYTEFGGDILSIEVTSFKGKGQLVLTGHLGDVMKESCSIALDYVRTNAVKYGISPDIFSTIDIHIHVPEGAVPKDGPSAGVAITAAIISCLTNKPISCDVAVTGEVTLRGNALPIGGLREKSLAALRSQIKKIVLPIENKKNIEELPNEVKKKLQIVFMSSVDDAIKETFVNP